MIWSILIAVGVVALGYVAGRWLFQKDTEVEDRRRAAFRISGALREKGMTVLPGFLEDYAVGDYSGMAHKLKEASAILFNEAAVAQEFEKVFQKLLEVKLRDPDAKAKLLESLKSTP